MTRLLGLPHFSPLSCEISWSFFLSSICMRCTCLSRSAVLAALPTFFCYVGFVFCASGICWTLFKTGLSSTSTLFKTCLAPTSPPIYLSQVCQSQFVYYVYILWPIKHHAQKVLSTQTARAHTHAHTHFRCMKLTPHTHRYRHRHRHTYTHTWGAATERSGSGGENGSCLWISA